MNAAPATGEIETGGQVIRYRRAGEGPPVVLLHASSSHSGQWKPLIQALASRFTLIAPDLHGYGRSDPLPRDGQPYFLRDTAAVAALVERYGGRAHLVGHSLGGTVALRLAVKAPQRVLSLTLIEPVQFSFLEDSGPEVRMEYAAVSLEVAARLHFGDRTGAARAFVDFWVAPGAFDGMDAGTRDYVVATVDRVADDWSGISAFAPGQIALTDCAALAMPCCLLEGERTRRAAREVVARLATAISGARRVTLPGAGHMAAATAPSLVNPAIMSFLSEVAR